VGLKFEPKKVLIAARVVLLGLFLLAGLVAVAVFLILI